jgi:hypothetical protein
MVFIVREEMDLAMLDDHGTRVFLDGGGFRGGLGRGLDIERPVPVLLGGFLVG